VLATGNGPLAGALFAAALRLGERTGVTFRTRTEIARDAAALLRLREELEPAELAAAEQAGAESDPDVLLERVVALAPAATAGS
jgi:hypothetical protein